MSQTCKKCGERFQFHPTQKLCPKCREEKPK